VVLADLAKNDSELSIRKIATTKVKDQGRLVEIAKNAPDSKVRIIAVLRIDDQTALSDIVKNEPDINVRKAVIVRVEDQVVLADRAKNDTEPEIRKLTVTRVKDQKVLADIARTDSEPDIRRMAIKKVEDKAVLADIAKNEKDAGLRKLAVNQVIHESVLSGIAMNDDDLDIRISVIARLDNQAMLIDIFKNSECTDSRNHALEKIDDESMLENIAKSDDDFNIRITAIIGLNNQMVLADIAKSSRDERLCKVALRRIIDKDALDDIANNAEHNEVRIEAVKIQKAEKKKKERKAARKGLHAAPGRKKEKTITSKRSSETYQWVLKRNPHYVDIFDKLFAEFDKHNISNNYDENTYAALNTVLRGFEGAIGAALAKYCGSQDKTYFWGAVLRYITEICAQTERSIGLFASLSKNLVFLTARLAELDREAVGNLRLSNPTMFSGFQRPNTQMVQPYVKAVEELWRDNHFWKAISSENERDHLIGTYADSTAGIFSLKRSDQEWVEVADLVNELRSHYYGKRPY